MDYSINNSIYSLGTTKQTFGGNVWIPTSLLDTKISSKWIKALKRKNKTVKLLEG